MHRHTLSLTHTRTHTHSPPRLASPPLPWPAANDRCVHSLCERLRDHHHLNLLCSINVLIVIICITAVTSPLTDRWRHRLSHLFIVWVCCMLFSLNILIIYLEIQPGRIPHFYKPQVTKKNRIFSSVFSAYHKKSGFYLPAKTDERCEQGIKTLCDTTESCFSELCV